MTFKDMHESSHDTKSVLILYTALYIVSFFACYGIYFILYHKAFFRIADGLDQHYLSFLYIGRMIRSVVSDLFSGHGISIPMWDMSIGYGGDVPVTFSAYLWDPFVWISAFFPQCYAEYGYALMIFLKIYAAGLADVVYLRSKNCKDYAVLAAAMTYVFSISVCVGFAQSFFINPFYIFPILMMGADYLWDNKRRDIYVLALAFSFANYFYFAYMMCILVLLYCVLRAVLESTMPGSKVKATSLPIIAGRFLWNSIVGFGIAGIALVPVLLQIVSADRLELAHHIPFLYDKSFYDGLFRGFLIGYDMGERDCKIGFGAVVLISVIALFLCRQKYLKQKIEFLVMTAALGIPYVGHVMNGFSYVANRWVFAYCLLLSLITALTLPEIPNMSRGQITGLGTVSVLYIVVGRLLFGATDNSFETMSIVVLLLVFLCSQSRAGISERMYRFGCLLLTCCSACLLMGNYFLRHQENAIGSFPESGSVFKTVSESGGLPMLTVVRQSDMERYDRFGISHIRNASWLYGMSGFDFYVSLYNNNIDKFHNDMCLLTSPWNYGYGGLNRRSELEYLFGVRHFLSTDGENCVPVGFDEKEYETEEFGRIQRSYANAYDSSMFYFFDNAISSKDFEGLDDPLKKQQALLEAVVIDGIGKSDFERITEDNCELQSSVWSDGDIEVSANAINVGTSGGSLIFDFDDVQDAEIYLNIRNIEFDHDDDMIYSISTQAYECRPDYAVAVPNVNAFYLGNNDRNPMYGGKTNWLLNLGYSKQPVNRVVVIFNSIGTYTVEDISVEIRRRDEIIRNITGLDCSGISFQMDKNRIYGKVNATGDKYLFIAIPYSEGWRGYIDGKQANVILADRAFMALEVKEGSHDIELRYRTPGLSTGMFVSLLSWLSYVSTGKMHMRRRK